MAGKLFLLLATVSVLEIYLIVKVGEIVGIVPTFLILFSTSVAGGWLVRRQGIAIIGRVRDELAGGRLPAGPIMEGLLVLVGGMLLLLPGLLTDFLGLLFLITPTRNLMGRSIVTWLQRRFIPREKMVVIKKN